MRETCAIDLQYQNQNESATSFKRGTEADGRGLNLRRDITQRKAFSLKFHRPVKLSMKIPRARPNLSSDDFTDSSPIQS